MVGEFFKFGLRFFQLINLGVNGFEIRNAAAKHDDVRIKNINQTIMRADFVMLV